MSWVALGGASLAEAPGSIATGPGPSFCQDTMRSPAHLELQQSDNLFCYMPNSTPFLLCLASRVLFPGPSTRGLYLQPRWLGWPQGRGIWHQHLQRDTGHRAQLDHFWFGYFHLLAMELGLAAADWSKAKSTGDLPMVAPAEICCLMVLYSSN